MKRILVATLALMITAVCLAVSPSLACEKIFERKDLRTEGHQVVALRQSDNYFRSVTAENDKKLLKDIKKAFEQDRSKAFNVIEGFDDQNRQDFAILNINSNGYVINIGFFWNENGYVNLFLQSNPAAFE